MKKRAIYSGTFDPITKGHLDIIKRSLNIYDEVIIAVATSSSKQPMFNTNSRIKLIQKSLKGIKGITIIPFDNLLVDFMREHSVYNIIRGLRTTIDFEYELQMYYANNSLDKKIDTIFLMPSLKYGFISSSLIRELIRFNGKFNHLIPKKTIKTITKLINKKETKCTLS